MKYWNKRKNSRANWFSVKIGPTRMGTHGLKIWCQRHESKGRFFVSDYYDPYVLLRPAETWTAEWLFEREDDAVAFKLIHG